MIEELIDISCKKGKDVKRYENVCDKWEMHFITFIKKIKVPKYHFKNQTCEKHKILARRILLLGILGQRAGEFSIAFWGVNCLVYIINAQWLRQPPY